MGSFDPDDTYLGGFAPNDGTLEFFGRIKSVARPDNTVLDLGAGRAAWFEDDKSSYRKQVRLLKGQVSEVIAADIDKAVLDNRSSDRNLVFEETVPLPDNSVDIIIADYVLEHIMEPDVFVSEIRRLLKPSGYFCARTPHKYNYVAVGARFVPNSGHQRMLEDIQPDRRAEDVFPTAYKLNTLSAIARHFEGFEQHSYIFRSNPSYFFGSKSAYTALDYVHRLSPSWLIGNIFAFLQKR